LPEPPVITPKLAPEEENIVRPFVSAGDPVVVKAVPEQDAELNVIMLLVL